MIRTLAFLAIALAALPAAAQEKDAAKDAAKNDAKPLLRLEAGGPTSNVTSMAFSPDGSKLYAAGYDKVVRVWAWNENKKTFELDDATSFRVPIGPGLDGAINALALSEDGQWLAVGGFGVVADGMKFSEAGRLIPAKGGLTAAMRYDRGQIFVFNTRDRSVKVLRGHSGPVLSLAFATGVDGKAKLLSAAEGWVFEFARVNGEAIVWDVLKEKEIDRREMPALSFARRPGLAMFSTPAKQLRAFLAWEDGTLIRWDLNPRKVEELPAPKYNVSLDFSNVDHRPALLMTGVEGARGVIRELNDKGVDASKYTTPAVLEKDAAEMPLAVRYIQTGLNVAAVIRRFQGGIPKSDRLVVVNRLGDGLNTVMLTLELGEGNRILPTLAASKNYLAVGGFPDHRILVYSVADLIKGWPGGGKFGPFPIILRSSGVTMRSVAFVKKGEDRGLALGEKAEAKGDVVFDISTGKLRSDAAGWTNDSAPTIGYGLDIKLLDVTFTKAGQPVSKMTMKEGIITATAVSPPLGVDVPLVAIASYIPAKGTTLLEIYNGATGQTLRRYVGHLAPIRGLSFRADGKLLASVADDQTTAVWSLTDLGEVLGKHGSLGDLSVELKGKDLTVVDAAGSKDFEATDVVRGMYDKAGKLLPLATSATFYEAVWMKKPGAAAKIRVSRGGAEKDVALVVRQGVDVRKPLFTLFFPRDAAGKLGEWLGWNAIGPYDASRKDVEQYLGWHFNTGKPEQPTSFAFIDQYRKEYFRPGLLKEMAELGDLPPPPKAPAPKPALLIPGVVEDEKVLTRVGGEYLLRKKAIDLHVTVPGYEAIAGDEMTWQIDGGPVQTFDPADGNLWTAKVDVAAGADATRRITVRMKRSPDGWPTQEFRTDLALRLVSPPPKIGLENPKNADAIKVDKAAFPIKLRVQPGETGVAFQGTVAHEVQGRRVASREIATTAKDADFDAALTLEPGLNVIQVRAVNDRAVGRASEDDESAVVTLKVTYVEKKTAPPQFVIQTVTPTGSDVPFAISGTQIRVESPKVTLAGELMSEVPLASAEWDSDAASKRSALPVDLAKPGPFKFDVTLKPGLQRIRFFAKTAKEAEAVAVQEIFYRPKLPRLVLASPEEGFTITGDADQGTAKVEVRWTSADSYPATVEANVFSDGKRIGHEEAIVDLATGQASFAKLPLAPGNNEIEVRLRHAFGGDDEVQEARGRYVRPPKIASLTIAPVGKSPFVDLTAEVTSSIEPKAEFVIITINGQPVRPGSLDVKKGKDDRTWTIEAKETPLPAIKGKEIKSDIALSLTTGDGTVRESLKEPIVFALPFAPAPEIVLLEPALREATLSEPTARIRFKATSEAPLTRAEIVRGDKVLKRWDAPAASVDGAYEFAVADVALEWGLNPIRLLAWNEGGVKTVPITLNVPPQPVRLEIDHVEIAPAGIKIKPEIDGGFSPVPTGRVVLHGSVKWNSNDDAVLQKAKTVRLFVNGFQQLPVEMKPLPGKDRERKFQIPVVLNFSDNLVEIDLPDLKQDAANRRKIPLGCRQPIRGQHLHVLVIAPSERDEAKLVESIARGLKAQPLGANLYKTPVFGVVRFYVLAKHVQLLEISSRLDRIAESLKERARAGSPNDLVMIYYQGKETVDAGGPVLWTSESSPWLQLTLRDLSKNYLSRFSGGQVLILDTISQAGDIDMKGVRFAYMRRPDPRPLAEAERIRFASELEKEMPRVIWLDQLATILASQVRPVFQSYLPEEMRNKIQLNPN